MITKAEIVEIIKPIDSDPTFFKVRMPIFDGDGVLKSSTPFEDLSLATACLSPYVTNSLKVGDKVFVAFEDNDVSKPVILGPLYNAKLAGNLTTDVEVNSLTANYILVKNTLKTPQMASEASSNPEISLKTSGEGNAVTSISLENSTLSVLKEDTFTKSDILWNGEQTVNGNAVKDVSKLMILGYKLIMCSFYFINEWSGTEFNCTFNPTPLGLNNSNKISCALTGVGDDNKYIKNYGVKISSIGDNAWTMVVAEGSENKSISLTGILGIK